MRVFRYVGAAASFLALAALASAAVQGFTIKQTPKQGDVKKFRLKAQIDLQGTQASLEGLVTEKTIKVDADGTYTVEAGQSELKINLGGSELPAPQSPPQVIVYKANGDVAEIRGEGIDGNAYRMAVLNGFFEPEKPVALNDTWTKDIAANPTLGTVAAKAEYKVLGEEKVGDYDTLKIASTVSEVGGGEAASNVGTIWLNKADWTVVKVEGKWANAPVPGAPVPINANYSMNREG